MDCCRDIFDWYSNDLRKKIVKCDRIVFGMCNLNIFSLLFFFSQVSCALRDVWNFGVNRNQVSNRSI